MNVSVVRPQDLGASEVTAWRRMQRSGGDLDNPFLSPAFTIAAGRVRPNARVAVLEEENDIVGFVPFEQSRFRIGRPIAAGVSDAQAVIHVPGLEWDALDLLKGCDLDVFEFDHLIASQISSLQSVVRRDSSIIDVSRGYQAYLAERQRASKKIFKSTFEKQRKLERDFGESRFEFENRDPQALDVLIRWKSEQYRRTGRRDRFAVGWIEQLVRDLFDTPSEGCAGTLSALYSAERLVAAHFGLRSDATLSCWFPAYDVGLARYSPGLSLHLQMAEGAATAGLSYLDLGKGDEVYKTSLKSFVVPVGEGWIARPSAAAFVHKVQRVPSRFAFDLITRHPKLRRAARKTLKHVGSVRTIGGKR
jgi:CelD/BcsL family acetyltransferase involved in cellulose biosynthesis